MSNERRTLAACTSLLAMLLIVYYHKYLLDIASFYVFDLYAGWHPVLSYIGDRLRAGQLPLWDPYTLNGVSRIDVIAPTIFYPLNLLFAPLSFNVAFATVLIAQQIAAFIGTFLLVSSLGLGTWAAVFAGAALSLCGAFFSLQPTPSLMGTTAWMMWAFWGLRAINARTAARVLGQTAWAAILIYLTITAGVAEAFAPALVAMGAFAIFDFFRASGLLRRRALWLLLLRLTALLAGVLMSMAAVMPAIEWSRLSPRSIGLPTQEIFSWSCNWYDMLCLVVLQPLGDLYDPSNAYRTLVATSQNHTPYLANAFLGPIVITLATWGAFDRKFKLRWLLLCFLAVSLIIALGSHVPPLVELVQALNLRMFRYPIKAMVFVSVSTILLAAGGMRALADRGQAPGNSVVWIIWILALAAGAIAHFVGQDPSVTSTWWHPTELEASMTVHCGDAAMVAAAVGLLCAGIGTACRMRPDAKKTCAGLLVAASILMFSIDAWQFNLHEAPGDFYRKRSFVADKISELSRPQGNIYRSAILYQNPHQPAQARMNSSDMISVYEYTRYIMAPLTNVPVRRGNVCDFTVGQTADSSILWRTARQLYNENSIDEPMGRLCQMAGAALFATELGTVEPSGSVGKRFHVPDSRLFIPVVIRPDLNLAMYKVVDPLPRAYFAPKVNWGSPHKAVVNFIGRPDQSHYDPHTLVVLEHLQAGEKGPVIEITPEQLQQSKVAFALDEPEHVVLDVETPAANFLVLTDQFFPGWHATVDRLPVPTYPANVLFRGVYVPPGRHVVDFQYRPGSLKWGACVAILGWLVVLALAIASSLVKRRRQD